MKGSIMRMLRATVAIAVLAGGGYGVWHAWDNGLIGDNPRAPTQENFLRAIRLHAQGSIASGGLRINVPCVSVGYGGAEVVEGLPDLSQLQGPGTMSFTVLKKAADPSRQRQTDQRMRQYSALTRAGFFSQRDVSVLNTAGNPAAAVEFILTREGWLQQQGMCFPVGKSEVLGIVSTARIQPDPHGVQAYEIKYKVGVRQFAGWTNEPEFADMVEQWGRATAEKEHAVTLYRGERGWIPASIVGEDLQPDSPVFGLAADEIVPPLDARAVASAIAGVKIKACLSLPAQAGMDAVVLENGGIGPLQATYFDGSAEYPEPERHQAWRRRLEALAAAGLFTVERIPADPLMQRSAGVRYTLAEAYTPYLDRRLPGCLLLGEAKQDMVKTPESFLVLRAKEKSSPVRFTLQYHALASIDKAAWSRAADLSGAPEAMAMLANGAPLSGLLEAVDGQWRLPKAQSGRDHIVMLGVRPRKAPAAPLHELAPKASPGAEVHLVSIYGEDDEAVDVEVRRTGKPVFLVLSSREKVLWNIVPKPGAKLDHVVVMGSGRLLHAGGNFANSRLELALPYEKKNIGLAGVQGSLGIYDIERLFGRHPESWQMAYKGIRFVIGGATIGTVEDAHAESKRAAVREEKPIGYAANGCPITKQIVNGKLVYGATSCAGGVGREGKTRVTQPAVEMTAEWGSAMEVPPGPWIVDTNGPKPTIRRPTAAEDRAARERLRADLRRSEKR
ncbi:MAG: hypothetical protein AB1642_10320 [Pseudomonadota bacterium]